MGNFFKNITYASFGTFFQFFIGFISTAIYIRVIGTSGYAIIGVVFSLFNLISNLDIPYFLALVKYNSDYYGKKKYLFERMFSTLYNSVLLSNIILFILLSLLVIFLSTKVYDNQSLIPFYFIALFIFMISRVNIFLKYFLRANKNEVIIQKALILSLMVGFLSTLVFLFLFKLGVMSIFIGGLIGIILEYFLLNHYTLTFTKYKPYFSLTLFVKVFKEFIFWNFLSRFANIPAFFWMGLFISTFYLDTTSIGILTIIISINHLIVKFYFPFTMHLAPVYHNAILKINYDKIKHIIKNIAVVLLSITSVAIIFLSTLGKPLYSLYFGGNMDGTYFLFLLMTSITLLHFSFLPVYRYIFVSNIILHKNINLFSFLSFSILLFPMINIFGLMGVIISYFMVNFIKIGIFLFYINKEFKNFIDKDILLFSAMALISLITALLIHGTPAGFTLIAIFPVFILSFILLINLKKVTKMVKYIIFEI